MNEWTSIYGEIVRATEDGQDVLLAFADGSIVRAHAAKDMKFTVECLADPDYGDSDVNGSEA